MDTIVVAGFKDDDGKVTRLDLRGDKRTGGSACRDRCRNVGSGDATTDMSPGDEP